MVRVELLGPVRAFSGDGAELAIGGARQRMLLARLALVPGEVVAAGTLVDGLWDAEPASANALQAAVSRLRKVVGAGLIDSVAGGYRLAVPRSDVDVHRFEELVTRGRGELAAGRVAEAAAVLGAALRLWRGDVLADIRDAPFVHPVAARLDDLRLATVEDRFDAELRLGRHAAILADLDTAADPLRERLVALRIRALCAAGRQAEALAAYEATRTALRERLGVDPGPELQRTHLAALRGELRDPVAPPAPAGNLPVRLTRFVGRDAELKRLAELLDTARLSTVVGPGGVGKTRLAVEAVSRRGDSARAWFVSLAEVRAPDGIADAVLGALGVRDVRTLVPADRSPDPLDGVVVLLSGDPAVLVVDNCEHLVEAAARLVDRLLERLPALTIVATSREPLGLIGETLCPLGALELPAARAPMAEAAGSEAVRLFLDRAEAVRPGFVLDASTSGPVVEICRRLDGLPLALELAAARLRTMSAEQIARRLDDRFRLLTTGSRVAQPRQRTLHGVIEWSWDLLSEPEQVLARRLSLFPGGATVAGMAAVCADPGADPVYVLGSLVEKSLVERSGDADPRYRMLETVRAYASERLDQAGERAVVAARFRRHCADLAEQHEPLLRSREQRAAAVLIEAEYANLVDALRTAITDSDVEAAYRLLIPLTYYWHMVRFDSRSDAFTAEVCEFGDALPAQPRAAIRALHVLAGNSGAVADGAAARSVVEECVRTGALERYPMPVLVTLGAAHVYGFDDVWDREWPRAQQHSDTWTRAAANLVWGLLGVDRDGRPTEPALVEALRGFEAVGDRIALSMALTARARAYSVRGEHDEAIAGYERSVALASELDAADAISYRAWLAAERVRAGDTAGAWRDLEVAQRLSRSRGWSQADIELLLCTADLYRRCGDTKQSDQVLDRLESTMAASFPSPGIARDLVARARMANLLTAGQVSRARSIYPRVVAANQALGAAETTAELLAGLLAAEGNPDAAARALGMSQALRGAFDLGNPELRDLVERMRKELGDNAYEQSFGAGAALSRDAAVDQLEAATRDECGRRKHG
ncbi:putative ATPase [Nocardia mexicana]|uniref:Putative ATPase n=1 Tax=Nocardia mexicana TaxID=279262 RepID=A0A370GZX3_9NOCA|nr:putative ATPase [Nocardia mexicana]